MEFPIRDTQINTPVTPIPDKSVTPALSVDQGGNVYVVWDDNRNGPETIFFNHRFPEVEWESRAIAITTGNPKNQNVEQGDATGPQICSDNSGRIYVVWVDNRAVKAGTGKRDIYLRYSKDFGASWLPEFFDHQLDTDTPAPGDSVAPQIACDEDGHVYVVWLDDKNSPGKYDVYFRSIQITFQSLTDIVTPLQFPDERLNVGEKDKSVSAGTFDTLTPQISTDGQGAVYVAWEDTRDQAEKGIYPGIYFHASLDHGKSWEANDTRIDHRPLGFFRSKEPRIAADNGGRVHVIWLDNGDRPIDHIETAGRGKLFYNRSLNYGETWQPKDTLLSNIPKTSEVGNASITTNNKGMVYVAWTDNSGGALPDPSQQSTSTQGGAGENFHVFVNHSETYGASWLDSFEKIRLDPGNVSVDSINPKIVSDNLRNVFVAWEISSKALSSTDVYFNFSPDSGKKDSWLIPEIRVNALSSRGISSAVQIQTDGGGQVHLVWQNNRSDVLAWDIYYNGMFLDTRTLSKGPRFGQACFIATAAYGSPLEPHVVLLRRFRDQVLLSNPPGRLFVSLYYHYSPPFARFLNEHPSLKPGVRVALLPFVGLATLCVQTSAMGKTAILALLLVGGMWVVRIRRNAR